VNFSGLPNYAKVAEPFKPKEAIYLFSNGLGNIQNRQNWSIFRVANVSKKISLDPLESVRANWIRRVNWNKHTTQCKMLWPITTVAAYTFGGFG
jgi:hypothetical protein